MNQIGIYVFLYTVCLKYDKICLIICSRIERDSALKKQGGTNEGFITVFIRDCSDDHRSDYLLAERRCEQLHAIFPDGTRECRRYSDCTHRCGIYRIYREAEHADRTFTDRIVHCVFRVSCDFTERIHALYVRSGAGTDPRHNRRRCRIHHQGTAWRKQGRQAKQEK